MNSKYGIHELIVVLLYKDVYTIDYYIFNPSIGYCKEQYSFTPYYGEDEKLSELLEFFLFNDIKILENADRYLN